MSLYEKHKMTPHGIDPVTVAKYCEGFNHALKLADAAFEDAVMALKRSYYEADAIAEGRNKVFVCAPVIRDYCKNALSDLGVDI